MRLRGVRLFFCQTKFTKRYKVETLNGKIPNGLQKVLNKEKRILRGFFKTKD